MNARTANRRRTTAETDIQVRLTLDGTGAVDVTSGIGFLDHMLDAFARHGRFDLVLRADGDLHVDEHHTVEDCALTLGAAFDDALAERSGIVRFGSAYVPLDESLSRAVWDLSGRPHATVELGLALDRLGGVSRHNWRHFFQSFATASRAALHLDVLRGEHDHHRLESAFKAAGIALRTACTRTSDDDVPSTKGVLV